MRVFVFWNTRAQVKLYNTEFERAVNKKLGKSSVFNEFTFKCVGQLTSFNWSSQGSAPDFVCLIIKKPLNKKKWFHSERGAISPAQYPFITLWLQCVATALKSHVKRSREIYVKNYFVGLMNDVILMFWWFNLSEVII